MHYPSSSQYDPHQVQYHHHSRVMTPVEGISPTSRPFHDFPPPGSSLKRLIPSRLALSSGSSGDSSSHRLPPPPEFTSNGSRNVFRYMDEKETRVGGLEFDNETTVTSMVAVSTEYPTRERRPEMPRFVRRRAPEEVEKVAVARSMKEEQTGEKMERGESVASGGSVASGVPLPPLANVVVEIESEKFGVERPKLLPPAEFCEEAPVFEEEDDEVEGQVLEEVEEVTEKSLPIVEEVEVTAEAPTSDTLEAGDEEELEQEEEFERSEEEEEEEEDMQEDEDDEEDEEEEDCDTVLGLDSEGHEEMAGTEVDVEGVSVMNGRLESVEECHDEEEEEEEEEEGSDLEEEENEEAEHDHDEDDLHEPHMEEHQQKTSSTHSDSDLGVSVDHDDEEHDQTAEGFLANLDNSSAPASSILSTQSSATTVTTLDSMFPSTTQSSASSAPTAISTMTSTDYSSGSSSASYAPQYMPAAFAYAPSPPASTVTSTEYSCSTANSSATTQYPLRNSHMMGMSMGIPHTPPRTQPGTRNTSPLLYKRTPLFPQQNGMSPVTLTEPQAFPRFTSLNLRLLRHLESELVELERTLEDFEARMVNEDRPQIHPENVDYNMNEASPHGSVRSRVNSGSSVSSSSMPGEMEAKRAEIMDALAWKLGQYNQTLVNYQTMVDTFGPALDPCFSTARHTSRDSGVASSRGSSGVRLSDRDVASEQPMSDYGGDCYESIPGGWGTQEQDQENELPPEAKAETQPAAEVQEKKDPETTVEDAYMPHAQDIDIVLTGKRPTWHSRTRNNYSRSVSSSSSSSTCCSSCCPSPTTLAESLPSHSSPTPSPASPERAETTLAEILAPPFLLLVVLYSLEWVSSWGKILGLVMVFGVGKAWRRGVEEGEKRSEKGRGRSGVRWRSVA